MDRMSSMVGQGKIKEAQEEAYNWTNPRFASKILTKDKMEDTESEDLAEDDCNSLDAVAVVKREQIDMTPITHIESTMGQ